MLKVTILLKRKAGTSRAELIDYYETRHARLGEKYMAGHATRYIRRYLVSPVEGEEPPYDVITELWFEDRARYERLMAIMFEPDVTAELVADEERVFDRSRTAFLLVDEERESVLPVAGAG